VKRKLLMWMARLVWRYHTDAKDNHMARAEAWMLKYQYHRRMLMAGR
jgi:hypothetical protein